MVFSSIHFIFYFLPIFLIVYFIVPKSMKNLVLFAASLVFYYYGIKDYPAYFILLLASVFVNYFIGQRIGHAKQKKNSRTWLILGHIYNFGWLILFKYLDFFIKNINDFLSFSGSNKNLPLTNFVLPIGISFYTFQISSYLIDVYRGNARTENSILSLGTYLCMFPQLIAGPIVTYTHVQDELNDRTVSFDNFEEGLREFTIGLGLKVLIANQVGNLWSQVNAIGYESISTPLAWLGIFAYSFQIYFDFYGYSLMAKGLGLIMGFHFPDNFDNPYLAVSMTDFWRRWHITLGSWFREYVYIPLGGNRNHQFFNLFVVWSLTGFWHGANWNFILWGLLLFVLISIEKCGLGRFFEKHSVFGHLYMLFVIPLSWLVFAITDIKQIGLYLSRLFPFFQSADTAVFQGDFMKYGKMYAVSLIAALIFTTGLPRRIYEEKKYSLISGICLVTIFWGCIYCMYMGMEDPFLYFQF